MAEAAAVREVSDEDKALAADWLKRISATQQGRAADDRAFEDRRRKLRGFKGEEGKDRYRTNLHFSNLAAIRPQIYAKDPEFAIAPTAAVPDEQVELWRKFGKTAEQVLSELFIRRAKLKKRMKRQLTGTYATSIGWVKICWQEDLRVDPQIQERLKDAQDNLNRIQLLRQQASESAQDHNLEEAKLRETIKGLESQAELGRARGVTNDFVMPEDILVLDSSVREITDYERSGAIAHRTWMTREQYKQRYGYEPQKARSYREQAGKIAEQGQGGQQDKKADLIAVWEIWEQLSNRVFTVCDGEEGFCRDTFSPDWTGKRWYPFFLLAFNEVDGGWLPLSDVELIEKLVDEYNQNRDDLVRDRKGTLPINVIRKGGSFTPDDVKNITNRQGSDVVLVEGVGGQPITDDIFSGSLGQLKAENYDTAPARADIEQIIGGGDAARGTITKAKTATEAEILSQGLRSRSAERTDIIEELLTDEGQYVFEMCLRKLSTEDVQQIAGPNAVWTEMRADEVFRMVQLKVRGGSTGKPDRLQEQDRWTKLLPVIEKCMAQVTEMRAVGQEDAAQAVIHLVRETLRRFDERIDIEQFLPQRKDGEQGGQQSLEAIMQRPDVQQAVQQIQEQMAAIQQENQQLQQKLLDRQADVEAGVRKAVADAEAQVRIAEATEPIKAQAQVRIAEVQAAANARATVEAAAITAPVEAQAKVDVAKVTAPIEAQAHVETSRASAETSAQVQMHAKSLDAEAGMQEAANDAKGNEELEALRSQVEAMGAAQEQLLGILNQIGRQMSQPKPRMKVAHLTGPDGAITESRLVPDEEAA